MPLLNRPKLLSVHNGRYLANSLRIIRGQKVQ